MTKDEAESELVRLEVNEGVAVSVVDLLHCYHGPYEVRTASEAGDKFIRVRCLHQGQFEVDELL